MNINESHCFQHDLKGSLNLDRRDHQSLGGFTELLSQNYKQRFDVSDIVHCRIHSPKAKQPTELLQKLQSLIVPWHFVKKKKKAGILTQSSHPSRAYALYFWLLKDWRSDKTFSLTKIWSGCTIFVLPNFSQKSYSACLARIPACHSWSNSSSALQVMYDRFDVLERILPNWCSQHAPFPLRLSLSYFPSTGPHSVPGYRSTDPQWIHTSAQL